MGCRHAIGVVMIAVLATCSPNVSAQQAPVVVARLQNDSQAPSLLTCWYNDNKQHTGADTAQPGAKPGVQKTGSGGDYAYGYTLSARDGNDCPRTLPTPAASGPRTPVVAAPSQVDSQAPSLLTCWYNDNKQHTGADTAQPGAKPGVEKTGNGGDYAYGYTFSGKDGNDCPKTLPPAAGSGPPASGPRTTQSDSGFTTFRDHCNGEGAPFILIRMAGNASNVVKLVLEHDMRVHVYLPKGTTFADNCGEFPRGAVQFRFRELD